MRFTFDNSGLPVEAEFPEACVRGTLLPLLRRLTALQRDKRGRVLALLAAPPGAGKSTLAAFLEALSRDAPELCPLTAVGMDGFHLRQEYLCAHEIERDGARVKMVDIKGAPETFDLPRLAREMARVAAGADMGWPQYDRLLHNPRENALRVAGDLVLIEGNYLLLDEDGWRDLRGIADFAIFLEAPLPLLRARLTARHAGSGKTPEAAAAFVERSDLANARRVLAHRLPADLTLALDSEGTITAAEGIAPRGRQI